MIHAISVFNVKFKNTGPNRNGQLSVCHVDHFGKTVPLNIQQLPKLIDVNVFLMQHEKIYPKVGVKVKFP